MSKPAPLISNDVGAAVATTSCGTVGAIEVAAGVVGVGVVEGTATLDTGATARGAFESPDVANRTPVVTPLASTATPTRARTKRLWDVCGAPASGTGGSAGIGGSAGMGAEGGGGKSDMV